MDREQRVAVIGAGCGGLAAAWHLNRSGIDVKLFESASWIGGHANTIHVDGIDVDTGFMVYNAVNYPNLVSLFRELGVEGESASMGFSVSMDNGSFEWCSDSISGLLATPSNAINPKFYIMMSDILRFNKEAVKVLDMPANHPTKSMTVEEFLRLHKFSDSFARNYLVPMTSAIWSASAKGIFDFPVITLFTFLNNHLLLQLSDHLNWLTPTGRSKTYVAKICEELGNRVVINKEITCVRREKNGCVRVVLVDKDGIEEVFDSVVFACHPDQALKILGDAATPLEKNNLGSFVYSSNDTYVHTDVALMPKAKSAWASWNYIGKSKEAGNERPVFVSYWLNRLQSLKHPTDIFVSLNPFTPPAEDKILARMSYAHPQYSTTSVAAQQRVQLMNGQNNTWFCGAWLGYGFHEDGCKSGLEVATAIAKVAVPWATEVKHSKVITTAPKPVSTWMGSTLSVFSRPVLWILEELCRSQIFAFMSKGITKGRLTFVESSGKKITFGEVKCSSDQDVTVLVYKAWFWVRVALEADLGLARSYIAGEWAVEHSGPRFDGLTKLLLLLIANMPTGQTTVSGGVDASQLATAWIGSALNMLWYRLTMDNSISNSRSNIHAHYDLSNELFKTFLDEELMMYSCAIFDTEYVPAATPFSHPQLVFKDTLEEAQVRKVDTLLSRLEPLGPEHTLLDIGFGWGGICLRAAEKYGCKVYGITLSTEQKALAEEKVKAKGLGHLVTFELVDYRVFAAKGHQFDRIVSCEMIEAVGHAHLNDFFETVHALLKPDGIFVMQAITMPDARYPVYHKSADFLNTIIFPGGCCPSLSALLNAMALKSTLHLENVVNMNLHYAHTLRLWRYRFNDADARVRELGFDDAFIRLWNMYLCQCEAGFEAQVINLQILTFSRPGNQNMIAFRSKDFVCR